MKSARPLVLFAAAMLAITAATLWLQGRDGSADGSVRARGAHGWLAARRYLEAKGTRVALLDRPLDAALPGTLVLTFPWQRMALERPDALRAHLLQGGVLVFAYSGSRFDLAEQWLAVQLGLQFREQREQAPLAPWRWRAFARREWRLRLAAPVASGDAALWMRAPARVPVPPPAAEAILTESENGTTVAFRYASGGGELVVVPAETLSNARITRQGHVDLLETLRRRLGPTWVFDEYHHGLSAAGAAVQAGPARALDLYLLHVAFAYALALVALARRFGPAWREPPVITGSTTRFLTGLGALHHRLGHHAAAAELLVRRAREWDPRVPLPETGVAAAAETGPSHLMDVARSVAQAQKRGGS